MTFNQIAVKIFKANTRRYLLYFLSSSFAIMVIFTYATIFTNKKFMDFDGMITSNLYAPGVASVIFSFLFIIYAQNSFVKFRKSEFGLLMVLGMTNRNIQKIILIENSLIAACSLLAGLAAGTVFSRLFYFIVSKILSIGGIPYSLNIESYLYTVIFAIITYAIVILFSIAASMRYEIVSLLKSGRGQDRNLFSRPILGIVGVILIGISFFDMKHNFNINNSMILLRSLIVCFAGVFLLISNMVWFFSKATKIFQRNRYKNTMFISDLKYTLKGTGKILFLITLLTTLTIVLSSLAVEMMSDSKRVAIAYNPYHIAFAQVYGKNEITEGELNSIIKSSSTPLTLSKSLGFIGMRNLTVLSDEDLNRNLGTHIKVEKGSFITLFQIVENDGYKHDTTPISRLNIPTNSGTYTFKPQGEIIKVLFNNILTLADGHYVILNSTDYNKIKAACNPGEIGNIRLMNFKNWLSTGDVLNKLKNSLDAYNLKYTKPFYVTRKNDSLMFGPASRIGDYMQQRHGGGFLLFLLSFVGLLFFISSMVILHFKLQTEYEMEKIKYKKLYKIGITGSEVSKIISKELRILFFLPFILSAFLAAFYSYCMPLKSGGGITSLKYSVIIGIIYFVIQILFYVIYRRMYVRKFIHLLEE